MQGHLLKARQTEWAVLGVLLKAGPGRVGGGGRGWERWEGLGWEGAGRAGRGWEGGRGLGILSC